MIGNDREWRPPPTDLVLQKGEVHVWRMALEQPPDRIDTLAQSLSRGELARADRFHFERDRRRFIVSHGGLRQILGRYLNLEPKLLQFQAGPYGKPYITPEFFDTELQFNLAHSEELALCAVVRERAVGIDLEYMRPLADMQSLAARYFSAVEYAALIRLPEDQQVSAFFNCWTRKEAYLKATGQGLSGGLNQFQVSLKPDEPPSLLAVDNSPTLAARWSLIALEPAPLYVAAAVIECPGADPQEEGPSREGCCRQLYTYDRGDHTTASQ